MGDHLLNELVMINQNWPSDPRKALPATWEEFLEEENGAAEEVAVESVQNTAERASQIISEQFVGTDTRPDTRGSDGK